MLSSYPNPILDEYRKKFGWVSADKDMHLSVSNKTNKRKTEALTLNY